MDSVVMTTPSSASKIRARVRSAFSAVCSRSLRKSQKNNNSANRQAVAQRVTNQQSSSSSHSGGAINHRHGGGGNSRQRAGSVTSGGGTGGQTVTVGVRHASKRGTAVTNQHHLNNAPPPNAATGKQTCPLITRNVLQMSTTCSFISEALSVWKPLSPRQSAPPERIQHMFNQMQLYPTKKQVQEMLQASLRCTSSFSYRVHHSNSSVSSSPASSPVAIRNARLEEHSSTNGRKDALSFAEFCVYAAELRRLDRQPLEAIKNKKNSIDNSFNKANRVARNLNVQNLQTSQTNINQKPLQSDSVDSKSIENVCKISGKVICEREYEVFLGGSCNPTTWRTDKAIPALEKLGISYYNPQVSHWTPELIDIEYRAKQCARVMFFVMDDETRSTAGSVEVAEVAAERRSLVLVVRPYRSGQSILNEKLSPQEYLDLSRNQQILQELVESRGLPVLSTIESALVRTKQLINNEIVSTVQTSGIDVSAKMIELRNIFDSADLSNKGTITIPQCVAALSQLGITSFDSEINHLISDLRSQVNNGSEESFNNANIKATLDFQQFCNITAELISRRNVKNTDIDKDNANDIDWVHRQVIYRQSSSNNNTVDNYNINGSPTSYDINDTYTSKQVVSNDTLNISPTITKKRDIYLGGSCMLRTKWRQNLVIPFLEEKGISYHVPKLHEGLIKMYTNYNYPSVFENENLSMSLGSDKSESNRPEKRIKYDDLIVENGGTKANLTINLIDIDRSSSGSSISTVSSLNSPVTNEEPLASFKDFNNLDMDLEDFVVPDNDCLYNPSIIEGSRVLLFYITRETRCLAPMTLAAFCIGEGRRVVLCIEMLSENAKIGSEQLTRTAIKDFNRGRAYLADMAKRQGVPVYEDILLATEKAIAMIKED